MKIIHLKGFTDEERASYKDIIHSNVIMAMRSIINASENLGIAIEDGNKVNHKANIHYLIFLLSNHIFFSNMQICLQQMKFYLNKK